MELKLTENEKHLLNGVYHLSHIDVFFKRYSVLDETNVHKKDKFRQDWMFSF